MLTLDSRDDPASVGFPLFEGRTCLPVNAPDGNCTVGGYPTYVVNVTTVRQIQLAVNFARNANLRLVIKNKGHDYNAKSTGGGGLSVYTSHLQDIRHIPSYSRGNYKGPALKVGVGAEVGTLYEYADSLNLSVVGGLGRVSQTHLCSRKKP
jgi:FAD/FMN-containing dehydrogenase